MRIFAPRTKDALHADQEKLQAERKAAETRLAELVAGRRDVELFGEVDELLAADKEADKQRLLIRRADARLQQIASDREVLEAEAEQGRRRAQYDAARKRVDEGRTALRDYTKAATTAADALARYGAARQAILEANAALPDGAKPLVDPEPVNGTGVKRDENGFPQAWAATHSSVLDRAVLPKIERGEFFFGEANVAKPGYRR